MTLLRRCLARAALVGLPALAPLVAPPLAPALAAQAADTGRTIHRGVEAEARPPARLFTVQDAYLAAGFGAATVALAPVDRQMAEELQDPRTQTNRFFRHAATGFRVLGFPGAPIIGGGLYVVGRIGHYDRVADLGLHSTEAILLGGGITSLIKGLAGRARPYVSADTSPHDFQFGRGLDRSGDYASFPSGHSTAAFAAAAAVTTETARLWPRSTWYVGPIMYGGAAMVGLSRMYNNKHWASDVAVGAAIGTFSGLKVTRYHHAHPDNRLDRLLLSAVVVPAARGGATVAWGARW